MGFRNREGAPGFWRYVVATFKLQQLGKTADGEPGIKA